jgi:hypothetical protein
MFAVCEGGDGMSYASAEEIRALLTELAAAERLAARTKSVAAYRSVVALQKRVRKAHIDGPVQPCPIGNRWPT